MCSGLARTLRTSAFRQPLAARHAFRPVKQNLAPAFASRFASTETTKTGKVHQVIGAVVDGMQILSPFNQQLQQGFIQGVTFN